MSGFRRAVATRVRAVGSAVGLLALLTAVLFAVNSGHGLSHPGAGGAAAGPGSSGSANSVTGGSTPTAGPSGTPVGHQQHRAWLRTLTAQVRCPGPDVRLAAGPAELKGFHPVVALVCQTVQRETGAVHVREASTDIRPLVAALQRPDALPSSGLCPAIAWDGPVLIFIDARGDTLRPAYPRDPCGLPQRTVLGVLHALRWTEVPGD